MRLFRALFWPRSALSSSACWIKHLAKMWYIVLKWLKPNIKKKWRKWKNNIDIQYKKKGLSSPFLILIYCELLGFSRHFQMDPLTFFNHFHHRITARFFNSGQLPQDLTRDFPELIHIGTADFYHEIKPATDHMTLDNFRNLPHSMGKFI